MAYSLALTGAGLVRLSRSKRSIKYSWIWMLGLFGLQTYALIALGIQDNACPIMGVPSVLFFMSWTLNLFYLLLGFQYRMSVLGVFTSPAIALCMIAAWLTYGMREPIINNRWVTWHVGFAMLAYGALGLACVAGIVYIIQDRFLKQRRIVGISRALPYIRTLQASIKRLVVLGVLLLFVSLVFAFSSGLGISTGKAVVSILVSVVYAGLLMVVYFRGLPGRIMAWLCIVFYFLALGIFFFIK